MAVRLFCTNSKCDGSVSELPAGSTNDSCCTKCGSPRRDPTTQPPTGHFSDSSGDRNEPIAGATQPAASRFDLPNPFGRYAIIKKLGQGGMATVYLARDSQLDRVVAIKVPLISGHEDSDFLKRFFREAKVAATFHDPNICPIHDVGTHDVVPFLMMAYIEGQSLGEHLKERRDPVELAEAARLVWFELWR
jgi:serine/threonine protein kinase